MVLSPLFFCQFWQLAPNEGRAFSKLVLGKDKVWFMVIYCKNRGNCLVRIICFDFIEKGDLTCCGLVASAHHIDIFIEEFNSIFWGLLRSFHVILLVLIKSAWPDFFLKSAIFWSLRSTYTKGTYSRDWNSIRTHPQKGKSTVYIQLLNEKKKKTVNKTVHILLSFILELNILVLHRVF